MLHEATAVDAPCGYHGCYWRIDVSRGEGYRVPLPDRVLRRYVGGVGLGVWLLLHERAYEPDPLSPEGGITFVFSPLVGSPLTTSAKFAVVGKSPLTDRLNDALSSSRFALAGKKTGCDAIYITGRAERPSVLLLDDEHRVQLEPADDLWGLPCDEAERLLRERFGSDYAYAVIGPAGETQVRYATVSHDGRHAGRGGHGAILGAKNVKAVGVRGSRRCSWAEPDRLVTMAKDLSARSFGPATAKYRELGTATNLLLFNRLRTLPTRNFQRATFEGADRIAPESLVHTRQHVRDSCASCTIGCEHLYAVNGSARPARLEYENLFALGPLCQVSDPDVVLAASQLCDRLGMDTISAGGTIAFAMECVERGLLAAPWLRFGDGKSVIHALELIARREGMGNLLAEGSRRMARQLGQGAMAFAPHVKGMELPGYEPRSMQTLALGLAVGTRGADHNRSGAYEVDFSDRVDRRNVTIHAVPLAIETEDRAALIDSLILCKFLRGVFSDLFAESAPMLSCITGWKLGAQELRAVARRIVCAKKLFNTRCGWTPAEDTLPDRFFESAPLDDPGAQLSRQKLQLLIRQYNQLRGWTDEGWLTEAAIRELKEDLVGDA